MTNKIDGWTKERVPYVTGSKRGFTRYTRQFNDVTMTISYTGKRSWYAVNAGPGAPVSMPAGNFAPEPEMLARRIERHFGVEAPSPATTRTLRVAAARDAVIAAAREYAHGGTGIAVIEAARALEEAEASK